MRLARAVALAVMLALPHAASAKSSLQGMLTLAGGWTDNILSVPVQPAGMLGGPQSDFFSEVRPSVAFTSGSARAIQRLAYTFDGILYLTHSEADSYSNRLEWAGFFLPSKTTELLLSASLSEGRLNTFSLQQGSATNPIAIAPAGGTTYLGATLQELLSWAMSDHFRFVQSLGFNAYVPLDPRTAPSTYEVDTHWIIERGYRRDAFGLDLRLDYAAFTEVRGPVLLPDGSTDPTGVVTPLRQQIMAALVARWRHDFGHFWNVELGLGGVVVLPANGVGSPIFQPTGLIAGRYLHPYAQVELDYTHNVQPNTLVAQTFVLDAVTLRGAVPFGQKSHVVLSASGGYQHGRVIDFQSGGALSAVDLFVADATLSWQPRREVGVYARYQYFDQIGNPNDFAPQPSLSRNTVMIGVTGTYPGEAAAVVPTRQALRVDRSDGVAIPEPHSEPQKN